MRLIKIFLIALCLAPFTGCEKTETFSNTENKVGQSDVVFFPVINIKGNRLIIINQGAAFTDPGVTATLNNQPTNFTTAGTVNTATPGVYNLTYTAQNAQGFSATDWRTVVVIGNDVSANDFSGSYLRSATGVTSTWTKIANGVYSVDNPGGATVGVGFKAIVVNYTSNKIKMPRQIALDPSSGNKEVSTTSETYNNTANPVTYSWIFLAGGYGTGLRTFVKQ